jgi:hypothetical protein
MLALKLLAPGPCADGHQVELKPVIRTAGVIALTKMARETGTLDNVQLAQEKKL